MGAMGAMGVMGDMGVMRGSGVESAVFGSPRGEVAQGIFLRKGRKGR